MTAVDGLLLFRAVEGHDRRAVAGRLLDEAGDSHRQVEADLWELSDAAYTFDAEPVAVAATRDAGLGQHVELLSVVVVAALRGQGIGRRVVEELVDALRSRGAVLLSAVVPARNQAARAVLHRAGFHVSRAAGVSPASTGYDVVCLDLEL